MSKTDRREYSDEEKDFLRQNIKTHSYAALARLYNNKYGRNQSVGAIEHTCARIGINHGQKGIKFEKGKRNPCSPTLPIGSESVSAGKVYVKISDEPIHNGKKSFGKNKNWVQKNRYVYEQHHGIIPDDYCIIPLDGNKRNFDIDNLYAIPRKVCIMMAQNKWFSKSRDITLAAVKWCELFYAIKNQEEFINEDHARFNKTF